MQGRSKVFIGGQAGGNVKFVNKSLQQNINPTKFVVNFLNLKQFFKFLNKYYHNFERFCTIEKL